MPDFKTPNLCGASTEFNSLLSTFDSLENDLLNGLETAASTLSSTLGTGLDSLISDLSNFGIPELPTLPNINLQSQLTSLASLDISSVEGLNQYNSLLSDITTQFGDALSTAGFSLDSLVSDATSLISGGDGLCGAIPNFSLPTDGTATQIADAVGQASKKIETELPAIITTAKEAINTSRDNLKSIAETSATAAKKYVAEISEIIPPTSGKLSAAAEEGCAKADAIIVDNLKGGTPAIQKQKNELLSDKSLDGATGTSSITVTEDEFYKLWLREVVEAKVNYNNTLVDLHNRIKKSLKSFPENINEDGTKIYINYIDGGGPTTSIPSNASDKDKSDYEWNWSGYKQWNDDKHVSLQRIWNTVLNRGVRYKVIMDTYPDSDKITQYKKNMNATKDKFIDACTNLQSRAESKITEFKKTFVTTVPANAAIVEEDPGELPDIGDKTSA